MEDLDVNNYLLKENLFELFKLQLKKDFEGAGSRVDFIDTLPLEFDGIRTSIIHQFQEASKNNSSLLASLLYRIDISEIQIQKYQEKNQALSFEETLSELMIKRVLQKVIFKKTYSK